MPTSLHPAGSEARLRLPHRSNGSCDGRRHRRRWSGCVLFGLEMYKIRVRRPAHARGASEAVHGVGPHTISVPRIKRADDIDPDVFDNGLSDELFAKVIACIRIAVPYTGMIISTRESQKVREKAGAWSGYFADQRCFPVPRSAAMRKRSVRTTF